MTLLSRRPRGAATLGALLAGLLLAAPLSAQGSPAADPGLAGEPIARGTAYFIFAEPGAPTIEVVVLGTGVQNGIYRLQRGVSLVKALALMGGTARSDTTEQAITTASVRVLRDQGAGPRPIFESTTDALLADVGRHPTLMTGDIIESVVDYEEVRKPFTVLDALAVASRVASFVSVAILLFYRPN